MVETAPDFTPFAQSPVVYYWDEQTHGSNDPGHPFRLEIALELSRFHTGCGDYTGPGYRREHGDVQCAELGVAAAAPVSRLRPCDGRMENDVQRYTERLFDTRISRVAAAGWPDRAHGRVFTG